MSTEAALQALGLDDDPFAADALPAFYFVGGQRRFMLQQALHGLYIARSIVLLCGERGAGKSHLLAALGSELAGLADCCPVAASVLMDGVAIRRAAADLCRLPLESADDNEALVAALARQTPADAEPLPVVLLIDDAHELAVGTLAELQQLVEIARGRIRLLLAGEPTLLAAWQQLPVAAAELLELQPLDLQESADYLQTRLQAAGFRGVMALTPAQMERVHRESGGCPGRLNALALAALAVPIDRGGGALALKLPGSLPWRGIGIGAAALILVALLLQLFGGEGSDERSGSPVQRTTVALPLPVASPLPAAPVVDGEGMPEPERLPVAEVESPPVVVGPIERQSPAAVSVSPAPDRPAAAPVVTTPAPVAVAPAKPVRPPEPAAAVVKTPAPVTATYRFDEPRLLAMAADGYVLQLMAVESQAKLDSFLKGNPVGAPTLRYEALRGGRRLLVLVAGPYADRRAAEAALARLPGALRATRPWPRTVASVQTDIRELHKGR